ncbi:MAG: HAD-IA family hydrolase [Pseudomonadota bacterium]
MINTVIFDFDGVVADSEVVANELLAECVRDLGADMSTEDAYREFLGKSFKHIQEIIEQKIGGPLPHGFGPMYLEKTTAKFREELRPVSGVQDFLKGLDLQKCIASSSAPERINLCLDIMNMAGLFDESRIFSATMVERGKPHPDIFLHASKHMGVQPHQCLVIEDSVSGVQAAKAAGAHVIGLLAASHIQDGHGERLKSAGADFIADCYHVIADILQKINSGSNIEIL